MDISEPIKKNVKNQKPTHRNFPMVPRVVFGRGAFDQLGTILLPKRRNASAPVLFFVDGFFEGGELAQRIPLLFNDKIIFVSAEEEPKTEQIDALVQKIRSDYDELPSGVVGIGGGSLLDLTKAVAVMLTNAGSAEDYQGWDLVTKQGIYHVGVPSISGTGAEVSRTAVLSSPEKKLGINSDYSTFDQVVLDPDFLATVPEDQWFYTGMDCFIHCVESLRGTYLNAFSQSYGEKAFDLCIEVFLGNLSKKEAEEKLMMASWHGGMSIAYSQVGVAHALSYGLSHVLGVKHGLGNCLVFAHLQAYYPKEVAIFEKMLQKNEVELPRLYCASLPEEKLKTMANIALSMVPLWENALGKDWRSEISVEQVVSIYKRI